MWISTGLQGTVDFGTMHKALKTGVPGTRVLECTTVVQYHVLAAQTEKCQSDFTLR
jgi:hypothetical protein